MPYITPAFYYENGGSYNPTTGLFEVTGAEGANWGEYQYVPLLQIVNDFELIYVGNNEELNNVPRYKILWHAKQAIKLLNFDAFREVKVLQLSLSDELRFVLPQDYVNWVRISLYENGMLYPLTQNIQTNFSDAYLQDDEYRILFDEDGYVLKPEQSNFDLDRLDGVKKSIYLNANSPYYGNEGYYIDGQWYFDYPIGGRYGLNTETANANPTFSIDRKGGVINFSSGLSGKSIIIEYVSDGMEGGDNSLITVNKLFEKYVYAYINYELLSRKKNIPLYIRREAKRERRAELANARIRMSDMHPGRLLMNLRGQNKWIK